MNIDIQYSQFYRDFNDHIIFLVEEDGGSDSGTEPQDYDLAEARFSRSDHDCTPSQNSEEVLCNMYTQAENWERVNENPVRRTLHHYLPLDPEVFTNHTAGNKYEDCVMAQSQSSSVLSRGQIQTLDFPLSLKSPQHFKAPAMFRCDRVLVMPPSSSSSKHVGQFSFFPKAINHEGGMFAAQSVMLPPPFMCQLPKHTLASQVRSFSNFLYLFQVCSF